MSTRFRRPTGIAVRSVVAGMVMVVVAAGPAAAKGPESVTIARAGGEAVELSAPSAGGTQITRLAEDLGIWETTGEGLLLVPEAPTDDLGLALTIEWTMYNPVPDNPDAAPRVTQTLYPHAAGGPLVHTDGGQRFFQQGMTKPGWFRAPARLTASLESLGVENDIRLPEPAPDPASTSAAPPLPAADRSAAGPALSAAAVLAVAAGLAVGWVVRRREATAD
jgi:hypothetical protein